MDWYDPDLEAFESLSNTSEFEQGQGGRRRAIWRTGRAANRANVQKQ